MEPNRTVPSLLLPTLVVVLAALLVFTSTLSFYPFPGESAAMLVRFGGLDPLPTAYHPLYALVAGWFSGLPVGTLAFRIGLISTLCGAASVAMLFFMVSKLRIRQVHEDEAPFLPVVAGLPAAAYLLFAAPFWASANRAHPILFHLSLLLAALLFLQRYGQSARLRNLAGAAFLFGLLLLEWAGTLLIFPFAAAAVVLYLRGNNHLQKTRVVIPLAACTLGVVAFIALFYARLAWATDSLTHPASIQLGPALFTLIGEHLFLIEREFHGVDGVLIAIGSIVPWLVAMVCARQEAEPESFSGTVILHIVLTFLCLILLFLGTVSPGMLNDLHSLAAVPPIVAIATVFGYVVGYWYMLADRYWGEHPAAMTKVMAVLGVTVCLVLLTSVKVNASRTSTRAAEATQQWASAVLRPLPPDTVVVAPANELNILAITARELKVSISPVITTYAGNPEYRRYIADTLAPEDLRDLAAYSLPRFLVAWLQHPDAPPGDVFLTETPAPFEQAGQPYQPSLAGYLSVAEPAASWSHGLLEKHEEFWERVIPILRVHQSASGFPGMFCRDLLGQASRTANDLAVLAWQHEAYSDALSALQAARAIDFNNLCAAANRFLLLTRTGQSEEAAATWPAIDALVNADWLPADRSSGGTLQGARGLRIFAQARPASRDRLPDTGGFRDALAAFVTEEYAAAESAGEALTREHAELPSAWLLAGLIAANNQDTNRFESCAKRLGELNQDTTPLLVAAARQAIVANNLSWAQKLMHDAVTRQPADIEVLETIASIELLATTPAGQPLYIHRLLSLDPDNAEGHYALGARLLSEGNRQRARQELQTAASRGDNPRAILLAALLTDETDSPGRSGQLALRGIDAEIDDAQYWSALSGLLDQMNEHGAAAYAAGQAARASADTPATQAFAKLIAAARSIEPVHVAVADPDPPAEIRPQTRNDSDLRTLLNEVVRTKQPNPATQPLSPDLPPSVASGLDDEEAPLPLAW